MPPKSTSKKQVKNAVKKAVAKKKTDAVDSTKKMKLTQDQFKGKKKG